FAQLDFERPDRDAQFPCALAARLKAGCLGPHRDRHAADVEQPVAAPVEDDPALEFALRAEFLDDLCPMDFPCLPVVFLEDQHGMAIGEQVAAMELLFHRSRFLVIDATGWILLK